MAKGGARKGAGRKKGGMNAATLEKIAVKKEVDQRIMRQADVLLDRMMHLSMGVSYLYIIKKDEDGHKGRPELVEDPETIRRYLDNDIKEDREYFFITTEKPDLRAIQDMFDRAFGKAQLSVDHTTKGDKIISTGFELIE